MTEQQLKVFLDTIKADPFLMAKLSLAADAETYVAVADEAGLRISVNELEMAKVELSEAELEGAGSGLPTTYPSQPCDNGNTCHPDCGK